MITTVLLLVAVAVGGTRVAVIVGSGVRVAVGAGRVGVSVPVGAGVRVGNGVGMKDVDVGNGVNVGKSKLNNGVGLTPVPSLVGTPGLGNT